VPEEPQAFNAPDVAVPAQGPVGAEAVSRDAGANGAVPGNAVYENPVPGGTVPQDPATGALAPEEAQVPVTPDGTGGQRPLPPPRTRLSGIWVALGCFTILLLFALIFILQNGHSVDVSYLGAHGHLPLGVALLLAGICGAALVGLAGTARILQLRSRARRQRKLL